MQSFSLARKRQGSKHTWERSESMDHIYIDCPTVPGLVKDRFYRKLSWTKPPNEWLLSTKSCFLSHSLLKYQFLYKQKDITCSKTRELYRQPTAANLLLWLSQAKLFLNPIIHHKKDTADTLAFRHKRYLLSVASIVQCQQTTLRVKEFEGGQSDAIYHGVEQIYSELMNIHTTS